MSSRGILSLHPDLVRFKSLSFTISLKPSFLVGWCFKELRLKLTLAKVGFKVEEKLNTVIGLEFALSFSGPELYFFCRASGWRK